ncbi:MAG: GTPase/DUF3482 domain-containing protein [Pseudomonadota bacterium]
MTIDSHMIPEFAIMGHPNEGKSSVVSTLAEDDRVRISPFPGETIVCQTFPITVDGREIIRFVDTPGFQNPRQTLAWMKAYDGPEDSLIQAFIKAHRDNPVFRDECELLAPVARGAGIIYVVDGSRPMRNDDRAEMEILRMSARPRMSVINCKQGESAFLDQWKNEFRKQFNAVRLFNAHKATFMERIDLLDSLKSVDQDWQPALTTVIQALKLDWERRTRVTAEMIVGLLSQALTHVQVGTLQEGSDPGQMTIDLKIRYQEYVEALEKETFSRIRRLFKHNIFSMDMPRDSIIYEGLFSEKTWRFLGLTPGEVVLAAGVAGGAAGAIIDTAAAGLTFGIFTAIGGAIGAGSALLGGKRMAGMKVKGIRLGKDQLRLGPTDNPQLMYVLLDRSLIFYSGVINWAHGRRDLALNAGEPVSRGLKQGVTAGMSFKEKQICSLFFQAITGRNQKRMEAERSSMTGLVEDLLEGCLINPL